MGQLIILTVDILIFFFIGFFIGNRQEKVKIDGAKAKKALKKRVRRVKSNVSVIPTIGELEAQADQEAKAERNLLKRFFNNDKATK